MTKKNLKSNLPSRAKCQQWEMLSPMLNAILNELQVLSKSKPNDALNEFKAKTINKILEKVKLVLTDEPVIEFLELLDTETLPTNSDAVLMIVQFKSAMNQFKEKYYSYLINDWNTVEKIHY